MRRRQKMNLPLINAKSIKAFTKKIVLKNNVFTVFGEFALTQRNVTFNNYKFSIAIEDVVFPLTLINTSYIKKGLLFQKYVFYLLVNQDTKL